MLLRVAYLLALCCIHVASAKPVGAIDFSIEVPAGWHIERDSNENFSATPSKDDFTRAVLVNSCRRPFASDNCANVACEAEQIRASLFWYFINQPAAEYFELLRKDGYRDFRAVGQVDFDAKDKMGKVGSWFAVSVVCGADGYVQVGSQSETSHDDAMQRLDGVVQTLRWHTPQRVPSR